VIRRTLTLLVVGALLLTGLVVGDEPPAGAKEDPPLRLKRKKRDGEPPAPEKKGAEPAKEKDKPEAKKEKEEPLVPEDGRPVEDEDEKDVLERVAKNMRSVEEKIANRELGEPTAQQQRDILKDIDSLIKKSEQQSGGGGGNNQPQPQGGEQDQQDQQQGGAQQKQQKGGMQKGGQQGGRQQARSGRGRPRRELRSERGGRQRQDRMAKNNPQQGGNQPQPGPQGNNPGQGGDGPNDPRVVNPEVVKDVWGHLPESLRAEMNAYSNPQPFMPRYDRVIREYYRTIAEQGRKKGD
jgi:hypothetical protein